MSPSKTMVNFRENNLNVPFFIEDTKNLIDTLKNLSVNDFKDLMKINEKIAILNKDRVSSFSFENNGTPSIKAYSGMQFKSFNFDSLNKKEVEFVKSNVKIASGLYGILDSYDSVYSYRLDMLSNVEFKGYKNLYDFWSDKLYNYLISYDRYIINLTSLEYSKLFNKYVKNDDKFINIFFKEYKNDKLVNVSSTTAKKSRGLFLKEVVKQNVTSIDILKQVKVNDLVYNEDLSDNLNFVFLTS
ncbi:MAG: YaaA family protein [Oscillospiraceae bacterium]